MTNTQRAPAGRPVINLAGTRFGRLEVLNLGLLLDGSRRDRKPSLDRVVPSLGYVKGNVRVISFRANRIKSDATADELRAVLSYTEGTP